MSAGSGTRRLVAEGGVIVLSILLAFAIDAGWDARQEGERRAVILDGLAAEFAGARVVFDSARVEWVENRAAALRLLEIIREDGEPPGSRQIPDSLLNLIGYTPSADPVIGAVESVLNSGDLALVRDPRLRRAVADWSREMEALRTVQGDEQRIYIDHMVPILHTYVPFATIDFRTGREGFTGPSRFEDRYDALLADLYFENWVDWRAIRAEAGAERLARLVERADSVLAWIEGERRP